MASTKLQHKTYSNHGAVDSHAVTLDAATRVPFDLNHPTSLVLAIAYDGPVGDQVVSVAVSGEAYMSKDLSQPLAGANLEVWSVHNLTGGKIPTATVRFSSAVKASMVLAEVTEIRSYGGPPLDLSYARVDAPGAPTTSRSTGVPPTNSREMRSVVLSAMAWSDSSKAATAGSGFGQLATVVDGFSGLGVAFEMRTAELLTLGPISTAFTLSPSSVVPAAVGQARYYRSATITGTDEDGYIDNVGGVPTLYKSGEDADFVYMSSVGPNPWTEFSQAYSFFPWPSLPAGVTVDDAVTLRVSVTDAFDDGVAAAFLLNTSKSGQAGTILDLSDEGTVNENQYALATTDLTLFVGFRSFPLSAALDVNKSGTTNVKFQGDTQFATSTYANLATYSSPTTPTPQFLLLTLRWPTQAAAPQGPSKHANNPYFKEAKATEEGLYLDARPTPGRSR